jgi:DNA-binding MarR family transcriptional regulator
MIKAEHLAAEIDKEVDPNDAKQDFHTSITLIERLHQKLHDLINLVLEESDVGEVTAVQALLIYNLGEHEIMVGELKTRGFYLGSNVSYNLKKLVKLGYVSQVPSRHDKRATRVSLTTQGHKVRKIIETLYNDNIHKILNTCPLEYDEIRNAGEVLNIWDQFWAQELIEHRKPRF